MPLALRRKSLVRNHRKSTDRMSKERGGRGREPLSPSVSREDSGAESDPRVPNHHPIFPANLHQRAKTNTEGDCGGGGTLCQHMDECCCGATWPGFLGALLMQWMLEEGL